MAQYRSRSRPARSRKAPARRAARPVRAQSRGRAGNQGVLRIVVEHTGGRDGASFGVPGMTPATMSGPRRAKF